MSSKLIIIDPLDHKNNVSLKTGDFRNIPIILKLTYYSSKVKCDCSCHYLKSYNKNEDKKNYNNNKENKSILFYRQINDEKEWFPKNKNIYGNNSLFYEKDFLLYHRKKFINYIREYMKSNNDDKNIATYSRKSTNVETFNSDFDYLENQNDDKCGNNKYNEQNNNNKNYMKEFEEEDDNINYNNDDY